MKKFYFDCETTGLDPKLNDIIQIAGIIEVNGEEVEKFCFEMQPFSYENISQQALNVHGITIDQIKTFEKPDVVYRRLSTMFNKYIDRYNKNDKFIVCGYNVKFDVDFLREFFLKNDNPYLFAYFGKIKDPFPVLQYISTIQEIPTENLKLTTVSEFLGIDIGKAHDAMADILATKKVIKKIDSILSIKL